MKRLILMMSTLLLVCSLGAAAKPNEKNKATPKRDEAPPIATPSPKDVFLKIVSDIEDGLQMALAERLSTGGGAGFPATLDSQKDGPCVACFVAVLGDGIADSRWTKAGRQYRFVDGTYSGSFDYDPASGKLSVSKH